MTARLFVLSLLFLLLTAAGLMASPSPALASPDRCPELVTDYSAACSRDHVKCGSYCFYAECLDCKNASHQDHGRHCHSDDDDDDDNKSFVLGGLEDLSWPEHRICHQDHGYHSYEISPCIKWDWHLYDPGKGRSSRDDTTTAETVKDALDYGLAPTGFTGVNPACVTELGGKRTFTGVNAAAPAPGGSNTADHWGTGLQDQSGSISIGDLTHLPSTPGESGAPNLSSVTKDATDDRVVTLGVTGAGSNTVQYRWWNYSGVRVDPADFTGERTDLAERAPSEIRVPFVNLPANSRVTVNGVRGIISFQVRMVDSNDVASGNSNIKHEMIGMAGFHRIGPSRSALRYERVMPNPPPTATPLPALPAGSGTRPSRPSITSASQANGNGLVDVEISSVPSGATVEYRWWPHSGFRTPYVDSGWSAATVSNGEFRITGVSADTSTSGASPNIFSLPFIVNVQVRVKSSAGYYSDPSKAAVLLVWGGNYTGW